MLGLIPANVDIPPATSGVLSSQREPPLVVDLFGVGVSPNLFGVSYVMCPGVGVSPNIPPIFYSP